MTILLPYIGFKQAHCVVAHIYYNSDGLNLQEHLVWRGKFGTAQTVRSFSVAATKAHKPDLSGVGRRHV